MKRRRNPPPPADGRAARLELTRVRKMARSSHAFVRANTAQFYEWLRALETGRLPDGPPVWICGDCHVGNLGPVADAAGRLRIQIRDLVALVQCRRVLVSHEAAYLEHCRRFAISANG